jgi:hypothetical protein
MRQYIQRRFDWRRGVAKTTGSGTSFKLLLGKLEIGVLRLEGPEWVFNYSAAFQKQSKVPPITNFPHKDREYRSTGLWPFFALRVPSLAQANVKAYLERNRKEPDEARLMRQFGRRSAANPFVLESLT